MESESSSLGVGAALGRWWGQSPQPSPSTDVMNQLCRVCAEPAAGFHFGAFTCEGCKSFFGRTYNNLGSITECKNNGECVINKKNRTACKACRLKKCLLVGMSKSGSRYGRRSNWFKIHCLLQEQQQAGVHLKDKSAIALWGESYKNLSASPHFDSESKGSPTDESITLNNNNLSKDRERSPNTVLPAYSAEAAAALWAARHTLFPMQLPHHPMPSLPFIPPFANFPPPGHPQSQRNILLPFIQNLQSPTPQGNHQPLTVSSSPSRSSEGSRSVCSQSPPPNKTSSPSLDHFPERTEKRVAMEKVPDKHSSSGTDHSEKDEEKMERSRKSSEEHSLALLRSLGPVQEQPMDLSVRVIQIKSRRKSKVSQRVLNEDDCISERSDDELNLRGKGRCEEEEEAREEGEEDEKEKKEEIEVGEAFDSMEANDENFNKRKNPLDLTKPAKLEI